MSETTPHHDTLTHSTTNPLMIVAAWVLVGVPLAYGLWQTLVKAAQLFG